MLPFFFPRGVCWLVLRNQDEFENRRRRGQDLVNNFVEELNGDRAPADGAVFIVPVQYQQKMPLIANHFQSWMWLLGGRCALRCGGASGLIFAKDYFGTTFKPS